MIGPELQSEKWRLSGLIDLAEGSGILTVGAFRPLKLAQIASVYEEGHNSKIRKNVKKRDNDFRSSFVLEVQVKIERDPPVPYLYNNGLISVAVALYFSASIQGCDHRLEINKLFWE